MSFHPVAVYFDDAGWPFTSPCLMPCAPSDVWWLCCSPVAARQMSPASRSRPTDSGDGCQQAVSAIGYADDVLLVLGQEDHQKFDAAVRSRLAAVAGTISLEMEDFPNRRTSEQAGRVGQLADRAQASATPDAEQILALREYRREAAQLVIDCAGAAGS